MSLKNVKKGCFFSPFSEHYDVHQLQLLNALLSFKKNITKIRLCRLLLLILMSWFSKKKETTKFLVQFFCGDGKIPKWIQLLIYNCVFNNLNFKNTYYYTTTYVRTNIYKSDLSDDLTCEKPILIFLHV